MSPNVGVYVQSNPGKSVGVVLRPSAFLLQVGQVGFDGGSTSRAVLMVVKME